MSSEPQSVMFTSSSPDETRTLGAQLGQCLRGGMVIGLVGPLGAGKTQFVKGVAVGNALTDDRAVTSPTFTLIHEYPGRLTLHHLDAYRLKQASELLAIGFDELQQDDSVVVVEWADRVTAVMPDDALWITLEPVDETTRSITGQARGKPAESVLEAWSNAAR